jgi:hypothetical protein
LLKSAYYPSCVQPAKKLPDLNIATDKNHAEHYQIIIPIMPSVGKKNFSALRIRSERFLTSAKKINRVRRSLKQGSGKSISCDFKPLAHLLPLSSGD